MLKRLPPLAVVLVMLGVMISHVSAHARPRVMPSSNACPVCTPSDGSTENAAGGKATPILF